jgi:phosphoribosylamine--glycine ligase
MLWRGVYRNPRFWQTVESFCRPGNPGIAEHAQLVTLDVTDHGAVLAFCDEYQIGFVVVGPEAPLVDGLGDALRGGRAGVRSEQAARAT